MFFKSPFLDRKNKLKKYRYYDISSMIRTIVLRNTKATHMFYANAFFYLKAILAKW